MWICLLSGISSNITTEGRKASTSSSILSKSFENLRECLNSSLFFGAKGMLVKQLNKMNEKMKIEVKTTFGTSDLAETEEIVSKRSLEAAPISFPNVSIGFNESIADSDNKNISTITLT